MMATDVRIDKIKKVVSNRQSDFSIILENIHDPHNLGAILRSCDAVGIHEIFALYTIENSRCLKELEGFKSSSGAKKWIKINYFENETECFREVRKKYYKIYSTHLASKSESLFQKDWTQSCALMFGNEHRGVSEKSLEYVDGNIVIPQFGMTQSLNISVACAVSLFEVMRQRLEKGRYNNHFSHSSTFQNQLFESYLNVNHDLKKRKGLSEV